MKSDNLDIPLSHQLGNEFQAYQGCKSLCNRWEFLNGTGGGYNFVKAKAKGWVHCPTCEKLFSIENTYLSKYHFCKCCGKRVRIRMLSKKSKNNLESVPFNIKIIESKSESKSNLENNVKIM